MFQRLLGAGSLQGKTSFLVSLVAQESDIFLILLKLPLHLTFCFMELVSFVVQSVELLLVVLDDLAFLSELAMSYFRFGFQGISFIL